MDKVVKYYVLLLFVHAVHLAEEAFGKAYFITSVYGTLQKFLIINILLWVIPVVLLYFVAQKKRIALYLALAYPFVMIIDGIDHVIEFFLVGYVGGAAGLITGIIFLPLGFLLLYELRKTLKNYRK